MASDTILFLLLHYCGNIFTVAALVTFADIASHSDPTGTELANGGVNLLDILLMAGYR
jgi:hypothetical protein